MCDLCKNRAHLVASDDPTRTLTLRNNYGKAFKSRLSKAADDIITRSIITDYVTGAFSQNGLKQIISINMNAWFEGDWFEPFAKAAVSSAFVQGSIRMNDSIEIEDALELPLFTASLQNAIPVHRERIDRGIIRNTDLVAAGALKVRKANTALEVQDAVIAVEKEIKRILTKGLPSSEVVSDANTLIVETHADSILNYYESVGVTTLIAEIEFVTAGDAQVCLECDALAGTTYLLIDARGIIPVHDGCRCSWFPAMLT